MPNVIKLVDGFYHRTEDDDLRGPYMTREEAELECLRYSHFIETGEVLGLDEVEAIRDLK